MLQRTRSSGSPLRVSLLQFFASSHIFNRPRLYVYSEWMPSTKLTQLPEGFSYYPDLVSVVEEQVLIEHIAALEFSEVRMHGVTAKRRVAHFGWIYGYESWRLARGSHIPDFLLPLRERAAHLVE